MGAEEAGGDEEGLVFFLAHHLDDFGGDHAVGFVAALRVNRFLPRRGVVEAIGADAGWDVVVVDFSDASGEVVGFDELL